MKTWITKNGYKITRILSGRSNVFLLSKADRHILIDTSPAGKWSRLNKRLRSLNIQNLDFLVLTHSHFDHASNAFMVKKQFNARVILHRDEESNLRTGINSLPDGTNQLTRFIIRRIGNKIYRSFDFRPCAPDILTDSIFDFREYGFNAYLLHTPGHSPGSSSLIADNEIAVVGDAMFGIFRWSVYPPYADDPQLLVKSWGKLLETGCRCFLPAHGGANSREKVQRDYDKRRK